MRKEEKEEKDFESGDHQKVGKQRLDLSFFSDRLSFGLSAVFFSLQLKLPRIESPFFYALETCLCMSVCFFSMGVSDF